MPEYAEVDWKKGACAGFDTHLFYKIEEDRTNVVKLLKIDFFRVLCTGCPIWKDCLSYAAENEKYGVWGGMTSLERDAFKYRSRTSLQNKILKEFSIFGISEDQVREALDEYSDNV